MPKCADRRFGGVFDGGKVGDIDRQSLHAVALGDTLYCLVKQRPVAIPYGDAPAGGEDTIGHRKTDALSPAGDHRNPLVQIIDIHRTGLLRSRKVRTAWQILPLRNIGKNIQQRRRELATDTRTCPFFCTVKSHAPAFSGTQVRLASLETE